MNAELYTNNLKVPAGIVDAVLDTDAYNEIDDQFAIALALRSPERINLRAIFAAPFLNKKVNHESEGMQLSFEEIGRVCERVKKTFPDTVIPPIYKGSEHFLIDEKTPTKSEAAEKLVELARAYSPEKPLYVIEIAAITTVASALLMAPEIAENIVIVWLGGSGYEYADNSEFNMRQDIAAGRVIFGCKSPLVQLPCRGVVSAFTTNRFELEHWFMGRGELAEYLAGGAITHCEALSPGGCWSKPIWDVTAIGWLLNDGDRFMMSRTLTAPMPLYDNTYDAPGTSGHEIRYVFFIKRDALYKELIDKLCM